LCRSRSRHCGLSSTSSDAPSAAPRRRARRARRRAGLLFVDDCAAECLSRAGGAGLFPRTGCPLPPPRIGVDVEQVDALAAAAAMASTARSMRLDCELVVSFVLRAGGCQYCMRSAVAPALVHELNRVGLLALLGRSRAFVAPGSDAARVAPAAVAPATGHPAGAELDGPCGPDLARAFAAGRAIRARSEDQDAATPALPRRRPPIKATEALGRAPSSRIGLAWRRTRRADAHPSTPSPGRSGRPPERSAKPRGCVRCRPGRRRSSKSPVRDEAIPASSR